MKSIREDMTRRLLAGIGLAVIAGTTVAWFLGRDALHEQFDQGLVERCRALAVQVDNDEDGVHFDLDGRALPEYAAGDAPDYYEIAVVGGGVLAASPSLEGRSLASVDGDDAVDVILPDGRSGRSATHRMSIDYTVDEELRDARWGSLVGGGERLEEGPTIAIRVTVARSRESLDAALSRLGLGLLLTLVLACGSVVLVVSMSIRRGLDPIDDMGGEMAAIDAKSLSDRVTMAGRPRELAPLCESLNRLLDRLESAFERERRLTVGMAHELRTPIAEIQSAAEIAKTWPDDDDMQGEAVETAHAVSLEMSRLVSALLRLSRSDAGAEVVVPRPCDLASEITSVVATFDGKARDKSLALTISAEDPVFVAADEDLLHVIVRNLIENAVSHSPAGGRIRSTIEDDGGHVRWRLSNSPVMLSDDDMSRLAEPFWTSDSSRSRRQHFGLGVTLALTAASAIGATLDFAMKDDTFITTFTIARHHAVHNRTTVQA